mmetsp:Transcript_16922/g.46757  ORF Transcript_16922/g.46757 Transcript_16922/m.46757 type:complete len:312 (+) Transcript_16922:2814-3749(+)
MGWEIEPWSSSNPWGDQGHPTVPREQGRVRVSASPHRPRGPRVCGAQRVLCWKLQARKRVHTPLGPVPSFRRVHHPTPVVVGVNLHLLLLRWREVVVLHAITAAYPTTVESARLCIERGRGGHACEHAALLLNVRAVLVALGAVLLQEVLPPSVSRGPCLSDSRDPPPHVGYHHPPLLRVHPIPSPPRTLHGCLIGVGRWQVGLELRLAWAHGITVLLLLLLLVELLVRVGRVRRRRHALLELLLLLVLLLRVRHLLLLVLLLLRRVRHLVLLQLLGAASAHGVPKAPLTPDTGFPSWGFLSSGCLTINSV